MSTITSSFRTHRKAFATALALVLISVLSRPPAHAWQAGPRASEIQDPFARARTEMIERDLRGRGIKDRRVLAAMD